jgi:hypothetical protein
MIKTAKFDDILSNVKLEVFVPVDTYTMVSCDMICYIPIDKYKHPGENRNFPHY